MPAEFADLLGNVLDFMIRHFNEGIYRRVLAMRRMGSKHKVVAQALGIAQGTVSEVLKRNRETGVNTPTARPEVLVRQQKEKTVICYVCAEIGVPSQQTPFVLSGYGSLISLYTEC